MIPSKMMAIKGFLLSFTLTYCHPGNLKFYRTILITACPKRRLHTHILHTAEGKLVYHCPTRKAKSISTHAVLAFVKRCEAITELLLGPPSIPLKEFLQMDDLFLARYSKGNPKKANKNHRALMIIQQIIHMGLRIVSCQRP